MRVVRSVLALATLPVGLIGQTPKDTAVLQPFVVTATRIPTPIDAVPMAVTVIRGDALREQGIRTVAEALRAVPGANVVATDSYGSVTSLFLRGGESDHVKVLIDGVPQTGPNGPGGAYDFANLTTDNVDRIEIVRGPVSTLYGSDAVTGVVQIFTRIGRGATHGSVGVDGGTYGTSAVHGWMGGGNERAGYSLGVSSLSSDGLYPFNNHYRNEVVTGRARFRPDQRTDAALSFRYGDALYHFPTDGSGDTVSHNQHQLERGPSVGLDLGRVLSDRVDALLTGTWRRSNYQYAIAPNGPSDTTTFPYSSSDWVTRTAVDGRTNIRAAGQSTVTLGAAFDHEAMEGTTVGAPHSRNDGAVYAQLVTSPERPVNAMVGLRLDDNQRYGRYATYRVGTVVHVASRTRAIASIGTAFKEPTFFQNFATGFVHGNPDLRPEHSLNWEVGLEHAFARGAFTARATYFDQHFRDLIDYNGADTTINYFNVPGSLARGVELTTDGDLGAGIHMTTAYTYLHTAVTKAGTATGPTALFVPGEPLIRRPEHSGSLGLTYRVPARGTVSLTALYTGEREDIDFATFTRATLPSYTRLDLATHVDVRQPHGATPGLTLSLRIENVLDHAYQEVKNFPARRRTLLFGGEVRFGT
jgi:vitamin B12 transporter